MQLGFVVVRGRSMEPTYVDGDVLLVGHGLAPRVGSCHVVKLPDGDDGPRPLAIKRVTRRDTLPTGGDGWWVERDNPREGVDSWLVGALPHDAMIARVIGPRTPRSITLARRIRTLLQGGEPLARMRRRRT